MYIQWNIIVLKRREILSHGTTWMHLEDIMLSKISQSQKTNTVNYEVSKSSQIHRNKVECGFQELGGGGNEKVLFSR